MKIRSSTAKSGLRPLTKKKFATPTPLVTAVAHRTGKNHQKSPQFYLERGHNLLQNGILHLVFRLLSAIVRNRVSVRI